MNYYFLHYTSAEVVEMMKTYEDQTATCGFIAISYGTREAPSTCLLYTSDAADERSSVDLGGRRIIKKKNKLR